MYFFIIDVVADPTKDEIRRAGCMNEESFAFLKPHYELAGFYVTGIPVEML